MTISPDKLPLVIVFIGILGNLTIAVIVWLLSQKSFYEKEKLEKKKAIGRALTLLLEMRHRFFVFPNERNFDTLFSGIEIPNRILPFYKHLISKVAPKLRPPISDDLISKYENSIEHLSGLQPLLGFKLTAKDVAGKMAVSSRQLFDLAPEGFETIGKAIIKEIEDLFTESIIELAKQHDKRTLKAVTKLLEKPVELPKNIVEKFKIMLTPEMITGANLQLENVSDEQLQVAFKSLEETILGIFVNGKMPDLPKT